MALNDWIKNMGYTDEEPASQVRVLVYGEPGAGKTHFAGTFPSPLFIDADRGLRTLKGFHHPYVPLTLGGRTYKEIMEILRAVRDGQEPFDKIPVETIVLDSLTEIASMLVAESMRYPTIVGGKSSAVRKPEDEKPQWDDYARIAGRLDSIMLTCRDMGMNVVATAGVKTEKDEVTGGLIGGPNIVGGYRHVIGHKFDEFFYMEPKEEGGKSKYYAYTSKHRYFAAKSRDGRAGRLENPNYKDLYGGKT